MESVKPRVLIVDDEPEFLELVDYKLSAQGFEVLRAATALEGLRRARCEAPQVILLDIMLPDLDGLAVCEILHVQPSTRAVPVLVLSALDRPRPGARDARLRITRWLNKGSDLGSLGDAVRAALVEQEQRSRSSRECEEPDTD